MKMVPNTNKPNKSSGLLPAFFNNYWNDDFFHNFFDGGVPATNVVENKKEFKIEVSTPGLSKEDFKIEINKNILSITAEKRIEKEEKDENEKILRHEFGYTSFSRRFSIPEGINTENITATQKNGVLKIVLPKEEKAKEDKVKQIEIQ